MQLISPDASGNSCTTSKVINMESPKPQTLENESFNTFLSIPEEKLSNNIDETVLNEDESMDVDETSENNEDNLPEIVTGEGILNGVNKKLVSTDSVQNTENILDKNESSHEELKDESNSMTVSPSVEEINDTSEMEVDPTSQINSINQCNLKTSDELENKSNSNIAINHSEIASNTVLNDDAISEDSLQHEQNIKTDSKSTDPKTTIVAELSGENIKTENVNTDQETSVNLDQSGDSIDLISEKLLLEEDSDLSLHLSPNSEDVNTTSDGKINTDSDKSEEQIIEKDLIEDQTTLDSSSKDEDIINNDKCESNENCQQLENTSLNDNKSEIENNTESNATSENEISAGINEITETIKSTEVKTIDSELLNNISNDKVAAVDTVKEENISIKEESIENPNDNNVEVLLKENENTQSVIKDSVQDNTVNEISDKNEGSLLYNIKTEENEQENIAVINNGETVAKLELETVDLPFQENFSLLDESSIKDEPGENTVGSIATLCDNESESRLSSNNIKLENTENVGTMLIDDEENDTGVVSEEFNPNTNNPVVLSSTDDNVEIKSVSSAEPMVVSDDEDIVKTESIINNQESKPKKSCELENSSDKIDTDKKGDGEKVDNNLKDVCFSVDDEDDDIVLIDDNTTKTSENEKNPVSDPIPPPSEIKESEPDIVSDTSQKVPEKKRSSIVDVPICPLSIMKSLKPKLSTMSREDLEEYVVVKIVESISGRSAISDIQTKLKMQEKSTEEWKKKVMSLSKQNKDLSIVLRNLCDEQHKRSKENPLPIKITRSVGLQVGYPSVKSSNANSTNTSVAPPAVESNSLINTPKPVKPVQPNKTTPVQPVANNNLTVVTRRTRARQATTPTPAPQPAPTVYSSPPIPHVTVRSSTRKASGVAVAPKLVPAPQLSSPIKNVTPTPNVMRTLIKSYADTPKSAEKRSAVQSIDLTDDEPPAKISAIKPPTRPSPTIRPVNTSQLTQMTYVLKNPTMPGNHPVYIPIKAQGQNVQQNNVIVKGKVLNKMPIPNLRHISSAVRMGSPIPIRPVPLQHPAPLPQSINAKTQLHSNWKWIPPRPTLKIARVDNGIVISWEMDDFSDSQHESVASYQIFAYQEPNAPPSTELWKKIGDVKALPLPMACTLTHFMAGYKYFFAVRAIDIRSRVGPFSAPGQITLVNNKK